MNTQPCCHIGFSLGWSLGFHLSFQKFAAMSAHGVMLRVHYVVLSRGKFIWYYRSGVTINSGPPGENLLSGPLPCLSPPLPLLPSPPLPLSFPFFSPIPPRSGISIPFPAPRPAAKRLPSEWGPGVCPPGNIFGTWDAHRWVLAHFWPIKWLFYSGTFVSSK